MIEVELLLIFVDGEDVCYRFKRDETDADDITVKLVALSVKPDRQWRDKGTTWN